MMPLVRRLASAVMFNGEGLIPLHAGDSRIKQPHVVYYPPVDTEKFVPSAEQRKLTRAQMGIPDDAPVVGMVANISPQKGIEYFVRAASLVSEAVPDAHFVAVGALYDTHKPYLDRIKGELARSHIEQSHFRLEGEHNRVHEVYPAFDVKLITSVPGSEGTTTTALESQACGVPVVATDVGAIAEVIDEGRTGFVVPPLQPHALAGATLRILRDRELRERMSQASRDAATARFDVKVCAETHVQTFEAATAYHKTKGSRP
jgi:glycosyltransferase involved in cell wall biosynthesis